MEASVWDSQPESAEIYEACAGELRPRAGDEGEPPSASFVEVADEVRRLRVRNIPPAFLRIVVHSWSASPAELYLQLVTFFSTWVDNHGPLIRMLDDVRDAGGAVLGRFREVLRIVARELGRDVANPGDAEAIAPVVADFLAGPVGRHYDAHFRISLLRFRLYQRICVETFADAARRDPHAAIPDGHLAELAAADVPLECAYEALRLIDA
jgi:hypothetical protein